MPATKAPSAKLSPASSVSQAKPNVINKTFITKSSSLWRRATKSSHQRISLWPPVSNKVINAAALSDASNKAGINSSGGAFRAGIRTSNGTTAKSWKSKIPTTRLPCSVSNSKRSDISLITIAVLLMANAPDKASAVCHFICHKAGTTLFKSKDPMVKTAMVSTTWSTPNPNTWFFMDFNFGKLNSRPITNMRKTTPNSARWRMLSEFCAKASALGPIKTPTSK